MIRSEREDIPSKKTRRVFNWGFERESEFGTEKQKRLDCECLRIHFMKKERKSTVVLFKV